MARRLFSISTATSLSRHHRECFVHHSPGSSKDGSCPRAETLPSVSLTVRLFSCRRPALSLCCGCQGAGRCRTPLSLRFLFSTRSRRFLRLISGARTVLGVTVQV